MLQEIYMLHNVRDKLIVQQTTNLGTENLQHFISYLLNIMVVLIYLTCYIIYALWKDLQEIVSCLTACQSWGMFCKRLTDLTGPKSGFLFLVFIEDHNVEWFEIQTNIFQEKKLVRLVFEWRLALSFCRIKCRNITLGLQSYFDFPEMGPCCLKIL